MGDPLHARDRERPEPTVLRVVDREAAVQADARREAEAAVADVMLREEGKAQQRAEREARLGRTRRDPRKALALLALSAFNLYVWLGDPQWLRFDPPPAPTYDYYVKGWQMALAMQADRIEAYRASKGIAPRSPREAGEPVRGVEYSRRGATSYTLAAGNGPSRVTYDSCADSTARPSLRLLLTQVVGPAGRAR